MSTLTMQTGHRVSGDVTPIEGDRISFVAEDGNVMFEIVITGKRSLEIRSVSVCRIDGELWGSSLAIFPNVSNSIRIETAKYD